MSDGEEGGQGAVNTMCGSFPRSAATPAGVTLVLLTSTSASLESAVNAGRPASVTRVPDSQR